MPMPRSNLLTDAYALLPHPRIDALASKYKAAGYDLSHYKLICTLAFVAFVLSCISWASCWHYLSWVGITHVFTLLMPYFGTINHPKFYFFYNALAILFNFISFCGGLSRGCWGVPIFVELPMMIVQGVIMLKLSKVDPGVREGCDKCLGKLKLRGTPEPTMATHQTVVAVGPGVTYSNA